jgi:hypothetical protein
MSGSDFTRTPNYNLYKPSPNSDDDQWGDHLNWNADTLDSLLGSGAGYVPLLNPHTAAPGISAFPTTDIYQSPDSYALTGSMTVRGQPYGYYDTGTLLSLVSTTLPLSSSRAGVNGGFEAGISAIAGYGGFDLATIYSSVVASPPPLVLHNVTYDATHVFPHPALTTAQIALLRRNMWVITNSIDTTVSTTPAVPNGSRPENHYGSYVTGWATDGSSITVCGWTVPGSGHTAAGQVPPVGTLDAGAANATAYFGSPTNAFGANIVLQNNHVAQPDSRIRTLQGIELDFQNWDTTNYTLAVCGISMSYSGLGGASPAADSYALKLSGFPNVLLSGVFNIANRASPAPWAGSRTTNLTWETQNYVDTNLLQLQCWVSRDNSNPGWQGASLHLGMRVDGTPLTLSDGTRMAQVVWNPPGLPGGFELQTPGGTAILSTDGTGYLYPHIGNAANDAAAASLGVPVGAMYRNGSVLMVRVA